MEFAKRMNRFEAGIFSRLLDMKKERLAAGGAVVDLSIGAPNIPPTQPIMQALADAALTRPTTSTPFRTCRSSTRRWPGGTSGATA